MAVTASSMILSSCRMIGSKMPGDTLTAAEQVDFLYDLNASMDSWGLDRSMCYQLLQESFPLVAGTGSYTIGSGGTFATARPNEISNPCFTLDANGLRFDLLIYGPEDFGRLQYDLPNLTAYPGVLFYDHAFVGALGTIWLYPKPIAGLTLYINSWKQLQSFATISTAIALPPGYQLAIESNFAGRLAGGLTNLSQEVRDVAIASMKRVKSLNKSKAQTQFDPSISMLGGGNASTTSFANFLAGSW